MLKMKQSISTRVKQWNAFVFAFSFAVLFLFFTQFFLFSEMKGIHRH